MCCSKTCYSNKTKLTCSKVVGAISLLLLILGIVLAAFAASQGSSDLPDLGGKYMTNTAKKQAQAFAQPVMIFGIILIVIAILGLLTAKLKHPLPAILFSVSIFILAAICLIVGGLASAGGTVLKAALEGAMKATCDQQSSGQAKTYFGANLDQTMCSDLCPCDLSLKENWGLFNKDETAKNGLNAWKRSKKEKVSYAEKKKGLKGMKFVKTNGVKTGVECEALLSKQSKKATDKWSIAKTNLGVYPAFEYFETKYDCSGICRTSLFFYTKPYDEQPIDTCRDAIVGMASNPILVIGYITFITGVISLLAFFGSFPLCGGFSEEEGGDGGNKVDPKAGGETAVQ